MGSVIGEMLGPLQIVNVSVSVDLNSATKQTLYTVPTGKTFIPLRIITRNASTSLTTAIFGFGFDANATDVIAAALHTALTGGTLFAIDNPIAGAKAGSAADVLGVKCSLVQGSAATATVDVLGYLI